MRAVHFEHRLQTFPIRRRGPATYELCLSSRAQTPQLGFAECVGRAVGRNVRSVLCFLSWRRRNGSSRTGIWSVSPRRFTLTTSKANSSVKSSENGRPRQGHASARPATQQKKSQTSRFSPRSARRKRSSLPACLPPIPWKSSSPAALKRGKSLFRRPTARGQELSSRAHAGRSRWSRPAKLFFYELEAHHALPG